MSDQWFSLGTLVSSTNKTDRHDIAEILLKVVLNTITLTPFSSSVCWQACCRQNEGINMVTPWEDDFFLYVLSTHKHYT